MLTPACLAQLKPSMVVIHLCALCTLGFCSALHSSLHRKLSLHYSPTMCTTAKMPLHQSHCSTTRFSAKMLFTTLTALHIVNRVAPLRNRDEWTVMFCDTDTVLFFKNSVQVQPRSKIIFKFKVQV